MLKKLIAAGATLAVALGIVALVATPAQAHTASVTAKVVCNTDRTSTVTWTILNDYGTDATIANKNGSPAVHGTAAGHLTPDPQGRIVPAHNGTITATETVSAGQTVTLSVDSWWKSDGYTMTSNTASATGLTNCTTNVPTGDVGFNEEGCQTGVPGGTVSAYYTIPDTTKIQYTVKVDGRPTINDAPSGKTDVAVGNTPVGITVTAQGRAGYVATGTTTWVHTFKVLTDDCKGAITPPEPTYSDAVCTAAGVTGQGGFTLATIPTGVKYQYSIDGGASWTDAAQGLNPIAGGKTVSIRAVITDSTKYEFSTNATTTWSHKIGAPDLANCVIPGTPTQVQAACDATDPGKVFQTASYTIPAGDHVIYKDATGKVVTGTVPVSVTTTASVVVTLTATPEPGYFFPVGIANPKTIPLTFTGLHFNGCVFPAVAANPQIASAQCVGTTAPKTFSEGSYELTSLKDTKGEQVISYTVSFDGGKTFAPATTFDQPVPVPSGSTLVINASVDTMEYTLNPPASWTFPASDFATTADDCLTPTTTVLATYTSQTCDVVNGVGTYHGGTIDLTVEPNVTYYVDGNKVDTGKTANGAIFSSTPSANLAGIQHTVTAQADTGYKLTGYPAGGWTFTAVAAEPCGDLVTHPVVDPSAFQTASGCFSSSTYTLTDDLTPTIKDAVVWTVNGSPVAENTYPLAAGKTVTVVATPATGYGFTGATASRSWTFTGSASAGACDLKTLALTGTGNPAGWLGLGYLLLVGGTALVGIPLIMRRRRKAE